MKNIYLYRIELDSEVFSLKVWMMKMTVESCMLHDNLVLTSLVLKCNCMAVDLVRIPKHANTSMQLGLHVFIGSNREEGAHDREVSAGAHPGQPRLKPHQESHTSSGNVLALLSECR